MNIPLFLSRFIYRIRYQLFFGSLIVTLLVAYFTQFLPKTYTVETSIYTGIISSTTLIEGENLNFQTVNNTFDNLISLIKSKNTLENVSLHLLAMNMIYGDPNKDNMYITAKNYEKLQEMLPDEIKSLVDKNSLEKTITNLKNYQKYSPDNFIYRLLNGNHPHYSYKALDKVQVKRIGSSDMIELSYTSNDPGITTNTVKLLSEELLNSYNILRYKSTNDAIAYFQAQVKKYGDQLKKLEVSLSNYNIENNIINYTEQTKATAISFSEYENRYEAAQRELQSSTKLLETLTKQMETRTKLYHTNKDFLKTLDNISTINGKITELEAFSTEKALAKNPELDIYKKELKQAEKSISDISNNMDIYKYSKEGVAINNMVDQWLDALIRNTKVKAELKVLNDRKKAFHDQYTTFSPVGTEIKSREREIDVTERTYLEMVHSLNVALLRKRNIQLTTAGLDTITAPSFPLGPNSSKRILFIIAAFIASIIFIMLYKLLIELLDRTLRDAERTQRLTGLKVSGVFSGRGQLRYRGYSKTWNRISASYSCNKLNQYLKPGKTTYINLLSIEKREGKSFIAKYMIEEWEKQGLKVKYIKTGEDFLTNAKYLLATDFNAILPAGTEEEKYNIVLIEYPAMQYESIPKTLLAKADINILIANACRVWKKSDEESLLHLKEMTKDVTTVIYLNNASREAVEDFTGELPPRSSKHSLVTQMMHMGLTAKGTAVKNK